MILNLKNLTERQHAALSVSLAVALLFLIGAILVIPAISKRKSFNEKFEELQFQYSRFNELENQRGRIAGELGNLRQQQADVSGFLDDKPQALAVAELSGHIKDIIESNRGNLISTQPVQRESNSAFPDVKINIRMAANIESLQEIFYALETDQITMLIDNVYLQQRNRRLTRRSNRMQPSAKTNELIETRFEVTGYIYRADTKS